MLLFFVGTGFSENHDSNTIYLAAYDSNSVSIVSSIKVDAGNPSALISHTAPNEDNRLYFVDETLNGTVHSLKYSLVIDTTASIPTYEIDAQIISPPQSSVGRHPCYLSFDRARKVVFVANYSEGSTAVLPLTSPSGCLQASTDDKTHQYDKKNFINFQDRQEHAHCHCVEPSPSNKWILVCDLGLSKVFVYRYDVANSSLIGAANSPSHLQLSYDAGPRHLIFYNNSNIALITCEFTSELVVAKLDEETGDLSFLSKSSTLPPNAVPNRDHHKGDSAIATFQNNIYVCVRCCSPGKIAHFSFDPNTNTPTLKSHYSSGGSIPRHIATTTCTSSSTVLICVNQESRSIVVFSIDPSTGALAKKSSCLTSRKPTNICFL